jgi:GNAT superfamily N-acetyltransferase
MADVEFRVLGPEDAGEVLTVQRAAFVAEARVYGTAEIPPLVETLDEVRGELETTVSVGAFRNGRLVGAARLTLEGPVGWISRVAVAPDQQGQGIGSLILDAVEDAAPDWVVRLQLAAGAKSAGNVAMYERRGYREFERRKDAAGIELICMGKDVGEDGDRSALPEEPDSADRVGR